MKSSGWDIAIVERTARHAPPMPGWYAATIIKAADNIREVGKGCPSELLKIGGE